MKIRKIRCVWHPIAGVIIGAIAPFFPFGAALLFIGFMAYQYYQDRCNRMLYILTEGKQGKMPDSYIDIEEMLIGLFPSLTVALLFYGGIL